MILPDTYNSTVANAHGPPGAIPDMANRAKSGGGGNAYRFRRPWSKRGVNRTGLMGEPGDLDSARDGSNYQADYWDRSRVTQTEKESSGDLKRSGRKYCDTCSGVGCCLMEQDVGGDYRDFVTGLDNNVYKTFANTMLHRRCKEQKLRGRLKPPLAIDAIEYAIGI